MREIMWIVEKIIISNEDIKLITKHGSEEISISTYGSIEESPIAILDIVHLGEFGYVLFGQSTRKTIRPNKPLDIYLAEINGDEIKKEND